MTSSPIKTEQKNEEINLFKSFLCRKSMPIDGGLIHTPINNSEPLCDVIYRHGEYIVSVELTSYRKSCEKQNFKYHGDLGKFLNKAGKIHKEHFEGLIVQDIDVVFEKEFFESKEKNRGDFFVETVKEILQKVKNNTLDINSDSKWSSLIREINISPSCYNDIYYLKDSPNPYKPQTEEEYKLLWQSCTIYDISNGWVQDTNHQVQGNETSTPIEKIITVKNDKIKKAGSVIACNDDNTYKINKRWLIIHDEHFCVRDCNDNVYDKDTCFDEIFYYSPCKVITALKGNVTLT